MRKRKPKKRAIDPNIVRRVQGLDGQALFNHVDSTLMGLHSLVDAYHYHDAPGDEVSRGIDALHALWEEILSREA